MPGRRAAAVPGHAAPGARAPRGDAGDELWVRYRSEGDLDARDRLLERHLGLVHRAAREIVRHAPAALELDDLVGAGTVGLVQALEAFDPTRGFTFSTFAMPRIRGAILDEVRGWDWVPRSVRERNRRIKRAADGLRRMLGREPEAAEMAAALGVDVDTYRQQAAELRDPVMIPFQGDADGGGEGGLAEVLPDESAPDQTEVLERSETLEGLAEAFASLSERDRLVLTLSYYEGLTLQEIGEVLHVTESRVSQLRTRAHKRLLERMQPPLEQAA
jgi:RNA polymerase sigma factor for flagellar operon FliA